MLFNSCEALSEVAVMPEDKTIHDLHSVIGTEANLHVANRAFTGAVTIAKTGNYCSNPLMTASNPGANAAAANVPSFITIKYGKKD